MRLALFGVGVAVLGSGCEAPDPDLIPDETLQAELGLEPGDRVHSITLSTATAERADPPTLEVLPGDYLQFVSGDWLVHEVAFEVDGMSEEARRFMLETGQSESPPLLQKGARFVLSFVDAPPGRYPYVLEGNRDGGSGVVTVADAASR